MSVGVVLCVVVCVCRYVCVGGCVLVVVFVGAGVFVCFFEYVGVRMWLWVCVWGRGSWFGIDACLCIVFGMVSW